MEEVPIMRFDTKRNLVFRADDTVALRRPSFYVLDVRIPLTERQIVLRASNGIQWRVHFHRHDEGEFDVGDYAYTGILVEKTNEDIRPIPADACCVQLREKGEDDCFVALYVSSSISILTGCFFFGTCFDTYTITEV